MSARLLSLALVFVLSGCEHLHSRDDLNETLAKHHIDLRWGRLGNAALTVKPEMREAFLKTWGARAATLELQDIEIAAVIMSPEEDAADVMVNITYVERDTMSVKNAVVSERWIRTDAGWIAELPAAL